MNVTLSIDDDLLARARSFAEQRGGSLNQIIRDYLAELTAREGRGAALEELERLWDEEPGSSGGKRTWTRESLYDRAVLR